MCVSQLACSSTSEAEPHGGVPPCLEKTVASHQSISCGYENECAGDRAGGFNESLMPGMYGQVYLAKISDLFF